jgi:pantoate--beta-alanine ligase
MTQLATTREELHAMRRELASRRGDETVAVVMTMGALHAGHAELVRRARARASLVIVTDFLNPLQFAPGEDLDRYPRTLEADLAMCRAEGVDLVFAPTPAEVYPEGEPTVRVDAGPVGDVLEGDSRPGHFDGVLTVVAKLLHLTQPHLAFFGRKDAQQLWLIERMVKDLDFGVEVVGVPTVRDVDGLALSSRNGYLSDVDRRSALVLSRALRAAQECSAQGSSAVLTAAREVIATEPAVRADYVELVDPASFGDVAADHHGEALLLVAAQVGPTRLIDNTVIQLSGKA